MSDSCREKGSDKILIKASSIRTKFLIANTQESAKSPFYQEFINKFACTTAARRGATSRMVEFRGRWVGESSHIICARTYISAEDKYADAFAVHCLCDGWSIKYEFRADADVTDQWMFTNVWCLISSSTGFKMTTGFCVSWV
jgi:hypothetical protein